MFAQYTYFGGGKVYVIDLWFVRINLEHGEGWPKVKLVKWRWQKARKNCTCSTCESETM